MPGSDALPLPDGKPRILFCGSATLDTIFRVDVLPNGPGKVLPKEMAVVAHGMAASAAAAAARLGARAVLVSRLGDDAVGRRIGTELTAAGVDCENLRYHVGIASALCTVIVDDSGERLVVPFYDPTMPMDPGWLGPEMVEGADAVMTDVRWPEGAAVLLDAARAAGKPAVLDGDIGPQDVLLDLGARATHAVFSEGGAKIASGQATAGDALDWLAKRLEGVVAVTLGAEGCLWMDRGRAVHVTGHKVRAVDTLAAGDVFHGVLTLALAQGVAMAGAITLANAAAAIKCQTFGGRLGAPDRAALQAFLEAQT